MYLDTRKKLTVGIGHLVVAADKLRLGDVIDKQRISELFKKDSAKAVAAAKAQAAIAGIKDAQFIVYLASVNFQLGTGWYLEHKKTWALIVEGKYANAAEEVGKSRWNSQTPDRVKDFQGALSALGGLKRPDLDTGMEKGAMKLILGKAKKGPLNCAVGLSSDGRLGLLLMHKSRKPRALLNDLRGQVSGAKSLRWGAVTVKEVDDSKFVQFRLNKALSKIDRRLRTTLKGTGFSKVEVVDG